MRNFSAISCTEVLVFHVKVTELEDSQQISTLLLIIVNSLSGLVATVGNGLVIWTLIKSTALRAPTYVITGALSILDFLVGIVLQPLWIATVGLPVLKTKNVCEIFYWGFAFWVPVLSSIGALSILTLIAVDRFIAVVFYLHYNRLVNRGHTAVAVAIVLLMNLCISVATYLDKKSTLHFTIISGITWVSYTVMIACYFSIYIALKIKARNNEFINRASLEITKTIALASLVCGVCWLPFSIAMPLVISTTDPDDAKSVLKRMYVYEWFVTLLLSNSALNFGIYYWRNRTMRQEIRLQVRNMFACCFDGHNTAVAPEAVAHDEEEQNI